MKRNGEIAGFYSGFRRVLGVAAFGSNADWERFNDSNNLDFLVLAEPDAKDALLARVSRLEMLCPIDAMLIQIL